MKAKDIMSHNVICVDMDIRLPEVRNLLEKHGFHHLPVTDKGKLAGIISDRDILRILSPFIDSASEQERDIDTLNRAAHQIMTRQPITVKAHIPITEVITWMQRVDISCVPVIDDENNVVGIISWRDLVKVATFEN